MSIEERYKRNMPTLTEADIFALRKATVLVAGCGGLGGYAIEILARTGIGKLVVADGDTFSESNLNRQLLCTEENLGQLKAKEAEKRVRLINSQVEILAVSENVTKENAERLMEGVDVVIDALDNIESRLALEKAAAKQNLPIVHGAIQGDYLQAIIVPPGSGILAKLYGKDVDTSAEESEESITREENNLAETMEEQSKKTALAGTAIVCATMQVGAAIAIICKKPSPLDGQLSCGSVLDFNLQFIPFA